MAETFGSSREGVENELYRRLQSIPHDGFFTLDAKPGFGVESEEGVLDAYMVDKLPGTFPAFRGGLLLILPVVKLCTNPEGCAKNGYTHTCEGYRITAQCYTAKSDNSTTQSGYGCRFTLW